MSSTPLSDLATESWIRRHSVAVLVMAVAATGLVGLLWLALPQLMGYWEHTTYDLRQRWQGPAPVEGHIVIISRDEESERDRALGPGLWDRARFAEVITALTQAGARTIALDFHMPATSPQERGNGKSDQALVNATKSGRVLFPIVTEPMGDAAPEQSVIPQSLTRPLPFFSPDLIRLLPRAGRIEGPFPALAVVAAAVGDIAAWPDADGIYRRVPTFVGVNDGAVPTFGVAMAASFLEVTPDHIELVPGEALRFRDANFPDGHQQAISIPVDAEGRLLIRYAGQWADYNIPNVRFLDVFNLVRQGGHEGELRELFSNKLVLVIHAGLASDRGQTPYEGLVPGGFILANIANTILMQQAMREVSATTRWGLVFGLSLCAAAAIVFLPGWFGVIGVVGLAVGYASIAFFTMPFIGLVLPMLAPLAAAGITTILALSWVKGRAADQAMRLEQDYKMLQRGLTTKQSLLVQQETRVDLLKLELAAAQEAAAKKMEGQAALERTVAVLQQRLQSAQHEAGETSQLVKELQGKLVVMRPAKLEQDVPAVDEQEQLRQECKTYGIITRDLVMLNLWKDFRTMAADRYLTILILGEPGTGKELFAQAASKLSGLKPSLVSVNMANIGDTAESALFGHEPGAFTGAVRRHDGYFLQANNGTIFLDEIGELPLNLQAKLLRVLDNDEVWRMGAKKPESVKVRVVAATNRDLKQAIKEGKFRADLYSRLCGKVLRLPSLRERPDDIPMLAQYFVQEEAKKRGRSDITLSQGALDRLESWRPEEGNIRELRQCMARAVVSTLAIGSVITEQALDLSEDGLSTPRSEAPSDTFFTRGNEADDSDLEFLRILRKHAISIDATATELGRDRSTVTHRLKGLCFEALVRHQGDELAAATSLAGEPGLTALVLEKISEYVEPLRKIIDMSPSPDAARVECKRLFKNMPKRYFSSVEALIKRFWHDRSLIQSDSSVH